MSAARRKTLAAFRVQTETALQLTYVRVGHIQIEWEPDGSCRITRQDNAQALVLSRSEWELLLKVAELRGWPIAAPASVTEGR